MASYRSPRNVNILKKLNGYNFPIRQHCIYHIICYAIHCIKTLFKLFIVAISSSKPIAIAMGSNKSVTTAKYGKFSIQNSTVLETTPCHELAADRWAANQCQSEFYIYLATTWCRSFPGE